MMVRVFHEFPGIRVILAKHILRKLLAWFSSLQPNFFFFFFILSVFVPNPFPILRKIPHPTLSKPGVKLWLCSFYSSSPSLKYGNKYCICFISFVHMNWEYACKSNISYCNSLIISIILSRKVQRNLNRKCKLEWWKDEK